MKPNNFPESVMQHLDINQITPYANNPRHNQTAIDAVAQSIQAYGFQQPIVVDKTHVVIAGHTRLAAAKKLGLSTIPVVIAEQLSPQAARAYRIADNRTHDFATWDEELLQTELADLADFCTGFDPIDVEIPGLTDEDECPEPNTQPPIVQAGELWQLGKHRLFCGDSTNKAHVKTLLGNDTPHLMVTDPPYGVNYDANWRNEAARTSSSLGDTLGARATGKVLNDDQANWFKAWELFSGDVAYIWHASALSHVVAQGLIEAGFTIRSQIIWAKNHFAISRGDYHWKHETCYYLVRQGKTSHFVGDRKQTTLWNIDKPVANETGHSTQKPVECMQRPIENNSNKDQIVYDPFLGSGTTIIAAENTDRICYGLELNPHYCDVIVQRWEAYTGKKAKRISGGL